MLKAAPIVGFAMFTLTCHLCGVTAEGEELPLMPEWEQVQPGALAAIPTKNGGYLVAGQRGIPDSFNVEIFARGLNPDRTTKWDYAFSTNSGGNPSYFRNCLELKNGGFVIVGSVGNQPSFNILVLRLDEMGNELWQQSVGGENGDEDGFSVTETEGGGLVIAGRSGSNPEAGRKSAPRIGQADGWIVRLDGNGMRMWDRSFGSVFSSEFYKVIATRGGGYLAGGLVNTSSNDSKLYLVRIDSAGETIWERHFGEGNLNSAQDLIEKPDGSYLIGGVKGSVTPVYPASDYWVLAIDQNGNRVWDKTFGGSGFEWLTASILLEDEGLLLGGYSASPQFSGSKRSRYYGDLDWWLVRIDSVGNQQWEISLGTGRWEALSTLHRTADQGFLIAGGQRNDRVILKLSPEFISARDTSPLLHVNPLINPALGVDPALITLVGVSNRTHVIEASSDLIDWTPVSTNAVHQSSIMINDSNAPGAPRKVYRARIVD